ncbi:hypothetical protein [Lactobacillus delbrueckii]|uniref:hypothetical protein n=1 Tax=Lactobacillus delbrueckii TaxID=1584 RepID=UPI00358DC417
MVFTKSSRAPLVITPAGQVLYKRAKKLVKEENSIKIEVKRANANNFRLGYSELDGKAWLTLVITHLNQGRMLANIETKEENSHLLEQHLREGRFDVIVFSRLGDEPLTGSLRQGMGVSYLMDIAVENVPGVKAIPLVPSQRSYCYSSLGIRENFIPNEVQKQYLEILKKNQDLN